MTGREQSSSFYENRSLFSDHYLKDRLADHKEWDEDVDKLFEEAVELYEDVRDRLPKFNEAQTEKEFIRPVLNDILGFSFDVQHTVKQKGRTNRPDYTLYPDEESLKNAQENREDDINYFANALAVGDAKRWQRFLDSRGDPDKDELSNSNPSFQIVNYLVATGQDWGILTNGRHWRLYYAKARSKIDSYFEVDLKEILEEGNPEDFKYFYHFFSSQAFEMDPANRKKLYRGCFPRID